VAIDPLPLDFGRDKRFCVYVYFDPRPRKKRAPIYVGRGLTSSRPDEHWARRAKNKLLRSVLAKIKEAGLAPIIEFVGFFDSNDEANALEKALIGRFGRRDNKTGTLCNFTDGGEGTVGTIISEGTRDLLRKSHQGKSPGLDTRRKMRAAMDRRWSDPEESKKLGPKFGHAVSADTRAKIGERSGLARRGRQFSAEHIENLRLGARRRWATIGRRKPTQTN
jgi:hypothetical protein